MLIELKNIQKTYATKNGVTFRALSNVSTSFDNTGLVFLVGASGSGKSTLLNVIGGLDNVDSGDIVMAGRSMRSLKAAEVDSLRNTLMGFVFQEFNLIDTLSVYDNVKLALDMQSERGGDKVMRALQEMGIDDKAKNKTKNLSGGQRQRVAIARALVKDPRIILADEPTGALDSVTSEEVLKILKDMSKTRLVLVVSHDIEKAAQYGDRIIEMKDGKIYRDVRRKHEGEIIELSGTQIVSDSLMLVEKTAKITDSDTERLNEIIADSGRKTFINVDTDPRRIKAMFPNLREAVDVGKQHSDNAEDSALASEAFIPYKPKNEAAQEFVYKKSRLPGVKALRLGLNNLNYKKGRLILTIIIALLAFSLFGVAQSFTTYNVRAAMAKTIEKEEYRTLAVVNSDSSMYSMTRISAADAALFRQDNPDMSIVSQYSLKFDFDSKNPTGSERLLTEFSGVVEADDVSQAGRQILYGKSSLDDYDSVIISQFAARSLIRHGAIEATKISEAVGHTVKLNDRNFIIGGIFYSEIIDYGSTHDYSLLGKFNADMETEQAQLFVKSGFVDDYIARLAQSTASRGDSFSLAIEYEGKSSSSDSYKKGTPASVAFDRASLYSDVTVETQYIPSGDGKINAVNEILLSSNSALSFLYLLGLSEKEGNGESFKTVESLNSDASRKLILYNNNLPVFVSDNFKVEGLISDIDFLSGPSKLASNTIVLHPDLIAEIYSNIIYPVQLYATSTGSDMPTIKFINSVYERGFKINELFVSDYSLILDFMSVLRYVLLGLALGLCLLVVLLLFNFISTSIRLTRKQIGILRALGAKKSDTFKIYAIEGFLVTLFALGLSIVLLLVGAPLINVLLSSIFGYYFALISIGAVVYVTMAGLAMVVTLLSVFIPLRKFNRITPISAISGKD